eukprot:127690_1
MIVLFDLYGSTDILFNASDINNFKEQNVINLVADNGNFKFISSNINNITLGSKLLELISTNDIICKDSMFNNNIADYIIDADALGIVDIYNCDMHNNELAEIAINITMHGNNSMVNECDYINNKAFGLLHIHQTSNCDITNTRFTDSNFNGDLIWFDGTHSGNLKFEFVDINNINNQNTKGNYIAESIIKMVSDPVNGGNLALSSLNISKNANNGAISSIKSLISVANIENMSISSVDIMNNLASQQWMS